ERHKLPAYVFGQFRSEKADDVNGISDNFPFGRRIDWQTQMSDETSIEDQSTFSLDPHPIDSDRTIINISKMMIYMPLPKDATETVDYDTARLWLMCAVLIRDIDTWQPVRNEYYYPLGEGGNTDFCLEVIKNDIQPWYITEYPLEPDQFRFGQDLTLGETTD